MKKTLKKEVILAFIIGVVLASSMAVFANINASEIDYKNNQKVSDALDDLYSKIPNGKITITENGNNIDVSQYATADVNVVLEGKGTTWNRGTFTSVSGVNSINIGFVPNTFILTRVDNGKTIIFSREHNPNKYLHIASEEWKSIDPTMTSYGIRSINSTTDVYITNAGIAFSWYATTF